MAWAAVSAPKMKLLHAAEEPSGDMLDTQLLEVS